MAGVSDKARFFLEQTVPELQELERKEVFSRVAKFANHTPVLNQALR
jgi:hypothetical protein